MGIHFESGAESWLVIDPGLWQDEHKHCIIQMHLPVS